jgi:galactonate dehydratase
VLEDSDAMKIVKVSTHVMGVVLPRQNVDAARRNWIFVRIETDEGITGLGEATTEHCEHAVVAMIEKHFGPYLIGKDPTKINRAWQEMQRLFWWRGGIVESSAISGIEQALWDITGKACGQPVYKLLGGAVRDRVKVYVRNDLGLTDEIAEVKAAVAEGFHGFKTGPGRYDHPYNEEKQIDTAVALFTNLRSTVGPDFDLMMDCLGNFSLQAAHRLIERVYDLKLLFVEEPVNSDSPRSLVELRRAWPGVRIAAGERQLTRWGVREWLELGAVDVLQVDITHCGGISELLRIASMAEMYNLKVAPHNPYGPVALAANLHACAVMPNFLTLEHWRYYSLFNDVQKYGPKVTDGYLELPTKPGLGVDLNWEYIDKHPYHTLQVYGFPEADGGMVLV